MNQQECVLCTKETTIMGIGPCNHKLICFECIIRMKKSNQLNVCPICKQEFKQIIFAKDLSADYTSFDFTSLFDFEYEKQQFWADCKETIENVKSLDNLKCPFCDKDSPSMAQFKQHLKVNHQKFFCDICVQHKKCLIQEHKLYNEGELQKHKYQGDLNEEGEVIQKHPFCGFCKQPFYDEEIFKGHLISAHIHCSICENRKLTFYKDYGSYEKHLKISHYFCEEQVCKDMQVAFKTSGELNLHRQQVHLQDMKHKINIQDFVGFYDNNNQNTVIDREGKDFTDQFLSLNKTKPIQQKQTDEKIDFRDFYYTSCVDFSWNTNNEQQIYLEDITLWKPTTIPQIYYKEFVQNCKKCLKFENEEKPLKDLLYSFENNQCEVSKFVNSLIKLIGTQNAIKNLQIYLTLKEVKQSTKIWNDLDKCIYGFLKNLKRKNEHNLVFESSHYSQLFQQFLELLNEQIQTRIKYSEITKFNQIIMDQDRIYQLIEVLKHLRTQDMSKLKFASNFGVSLQTIELIRKQVFLNDKSQAQNHLSNIKLHEFLPLYQYTKNCCRILKGENISVQKTLINQNCFQEIFDKNPQLQEKIADYKNKQSLRQFPIPPQTFFEQLKDKEFPSLPKKDNVPEQLKQLKIKEKGFQMDESFVPLQVLEGESKPENKIEEKQQKNNSGIVEISKITKKGKTIVQINGGFC